MSSPTSSLSLSSLQTVALPTITALFGALAFLGGTYHFTSPIDSAKMFGLTYPTTSSSTDKKTQAWQKAYVKVHGIRNMASGISSMGLMGFLYLSKFCRDSPVAAQAVRKCIGICLVAGTVAAVGDGYILSRFVREARDEKAEDDDGAGKDKSIALAEEKSKGHMMMGLPILAIGLGWFFS
ncbi:MAG: hypothetical protein Q9227_009548 [Pyrenula ochraceoflavens]